MSKIFVSFDEYLLENISDQTMDKLEDLITNKLVSVVDYRGEHIGDILDGIRVIEPYSVGVGEKGETYMRAWLVKGISKTGKIDPRCVPGWRLFKVSRVKTINPTLQKFTVARKGYNKQDSIMKEVMFTASF